jgi:hypothetical protein
MTYSDLIDYLQTKALVVNPTGTFVHGKKPDASLISTNMVYPLIWVAPFRETTDRLKNKISRQVTIAFFAQDSTQNTLDQRQALIQTMWDLKELYVASLNNDLPKVLSALNESATPEYSQLGGYVSGYAISFNIQTKLPC